MKKIEKKCPKHGCTTFLSLSLGDLVGSIEACVQCLEEEIEKVHKEKARAK